MSPGDIICYNVSRASKYFRNGSVSSYTKLDSTLSHLTIPNNGKIKEKGAVSRLQIPLVCCTSSTRYCIQERRLD
jgi:hypothetical protein